jgi:signal transduction histidine kinase
LSELMVFAQDQNKALGKPVTASDSNRFAPLWNAQYLTDGYVPFSQPRTRKKSKTNFCQIRIHDQDTPASITLDLGKEHRLDEVRLYPVHIGSNFAVFHRTAQGFPRQFKIEISTDPLFTSPVVIFDTLLKDYPSPGHRLVSFSAHNTPGRFVRITALQPAPDPHSKDYILAFAEIEVMAEGSVVSHGVDVAVSHPTYAKNYSPEQLVDGLSSHGTIPPLRTWLIDLSERNRMEIKLQTLQSELQRRYHRQSLIIQRLGWIIAICILFFMISILWQRLIRQRHIYRLRENIAADLHDEIGGNFSGIALLCDELAHDENMPEDHIPQLMSIANTSRASARNTRDLVRFLESHGVNGELIEKMQSTADRMLTNQTCRFDIEGAKYINKLAPKDKWHLLLFFKEALTNIVKHAESTEVALMLHLNARRLTLTISDNGRGMGGQGERQPAHLAMRALKLKSKLTLSTPSGGGTEVTLEKKL